MQEYGRPNVYVFTIKLLFHLIYFIRRYNGCIVIHKLHVNDPVNMYPIHRYIQVYILLENLKKKMI